MSVLAIHARATGVAAVVVTVDGSIAARGFHPVERHAPRPGWVEQSADDQGHIVGLTNWRLAGLQRAIRAGAVPPFEQLMQADNNAFYNRDPGTNYGQARYLCFYLQERDLLVRYYREFRAGRADDPTGLQTLKRVLGENDLAAFKKHWEAFVLALTFP